MPTVDELLRIAAIRRKRHGWTPARLAGLALWLRADQGITESSGAVSAWADQSGAGNHSTSTSTTKPTVVADAMNGRPVVRFTAASTTWIAFDTVAALLAGSDIPYSLFFAAAIVDTSANRVWLSAGGSSTNARIYCGNNSAAWFDDRLDDAAAETGRSSAAGAITTAPHVHAIDFAGTTIVHRVDGASVLTASAMDTGTMTLDRFTLGALRRSTAASPANADIAEVILVPGRVASAAESTRVQAYLAARYGVTLA